ncbi:MAG: hypothetical protein ABW019_13285 [Chitinophagaceae bacterium]
MEHVQTSKPDTTIVPPTSNSEHPNPLERNLTSKKRLPHNKHRLMKHTPLKITIPKPCHESWEKMEQHEKGRFCGNCRKTVIDFSYLSDTELYHYLRSAREIPCGRFHTSQLNKAIVPPSRKSFAWKNVYKAALTAFAFLTMKYSGATGTRHEYRVAVQQPDPKQQDVDTGNKFIISGIVRNNKDSALEHAEIRIGETIIAYTDKDGKFSFEIPDNLAGKSFIFSVQYTGLPGSVRSYHPVMQSTDYNIMLYPPYCGPCSAMGIISFDPNFPAITISFTKTSTTLSEAIRKTLAETAATLRNNPETIVNVVAYPQNSKASLIAKKRQSAVIKYLIDEEGIDETRLLPAIRPYSAEKGNSIEITAE